MLKGVAVPTLSTDGWIIDPVKALDRLLSYFFESDKSQTYCYGDNVRSLAWLYTTYSLDPDNLAIEIARDIEKLLQPHYKKVNSTCRSNIDTTNENKVELTLAVSVTTNKGEHIDLAKIIRGNNTKITEIINYLNG